jgi:hypothetical protein
MTRGTKVLRLPSTHTMSSANDSKANPSRPKTMGYVGSEEFIRLQFEEYLLSMISSVKYRIYSEMHRDEPRSLLPNVGSCGVEALSMK